MLPAYQSRIPDQTLLVRRFGVRSSACITTKRLSLNLSYAWTTVAIMVACNVIDRQDPPAALVGPIRRGLARGQQRPRRQYAPSRRAIIALFCTLRYRSGRMADNRRDQLGQQGLFGVLVWAMTAACGLARSCQFLTFGSASGSAAGRCRQQAFQQCPGLRLPVETSGGDLRCARWAST